MYPITSQLLYRRRLLYITLLLDVEAGLHVYIILIGLGQ